MNCHNCEALIVERYCGFCGQKAKINLDPTIKDILHDSLHELFHLDGKIFQTLWVLLRYPGKLTVDFLNGRRTKYISPLRLYLSMSIAFFLLSALIHVSPVRFTIAGTETEIFKKSEEPLKYRLQRGREAVRADQDAFRDQVVHTFPKVLFLLMPLFALLLRLTYLKHMQKYSQYLYFALHYHAALFGGLILQLPFQGMLHEGKPLPIWPLFALLYLFLSLKRVWNDSSQQAFFRSTVTLLLYAVCFAGAAWCVLVYNILVLGSDLTV